MPDSTELSDGAPEWRRRPRRITASAGDGVTSEQLLKRTDETAGGIDVVLGRKLVLALAKADTHRRVSRIVDDQLLQPAEAGGRRLRRGYLEQDRRVGRLCHQVERGDVERDELGLLVAMVEPGTEGDDRVVDQDRAVLLHGLREDEDFDRSLEVLEQSVRESTGRRALPAPPLMHGAGQWIALGMLLGGGTVVFPDTVSSFDPGSVLDAIERERVDFLAIVGEAFARPLCEELERRPRDLTSLGAIVSGGAAMSVGTKTRLHTLLPSTVLVDSGGASETGPQLSNVSAAGGEPTSGYRTFTLWIIPNTVYRRGIHVEVVTPADAPVADTVLP